MQWGCNGDAMGMQWGVHVSSARPPWHNRVVKRARGLLSPYSALPISRGVSSCEDWEILGARASSMPCISGVELSIPVVHHMRGHEGACQGMKATAWEVVLCGDRDKAAVHGECSVRVCQDRRKYGRTQWGKH